ncbi:hypothetical protein DCAR_0933993 [Daucus carota subsp. sativus]|uniref:Uncharacterized protein n=1 Tax=Daucus carota subsp. sativus TaxID=79200 RepID=A0A175YEH3_DAUCS|nr:hypothetical protein DCAR_0933993 [Daucus carota subsp. sativus]
MKSARLSYAAFEDSHFLESCFLCRKSLHNCDIFMYRGNTPFCSQECRQEQIEIDEGSERKWKVSSSSKRSSTSSTKKPSSKTVQTGTIAVS